MLLYDNVIFSGKKDNFKAALYFGYGNHGNFNSLWGDYDLDPAEGFFLNRKELLIMAWDLQKKFQGENFYNLTWKI